LGRRLAIFFATHYEYEMPFAGVTAKAARAHCAEITAAGRELRSANAAVKSKKRGRDAAEKSLRREMSFVVVALSHQLGKSDPRWLEFGLKQPKPTLRQRLFATAEEFRSRPP
jgi:L-amino acid N-acyltransferase YncA